MESPAPILVSGKSGQLGRCLFDAASARNIPLILAGRPDFDVTDRASMDRAITDAKPSVIINAAAYTAVDKAEAEPERCYAVNRDGAGQLAEVAWRHTLPFIHVSTDYVFDGQKPSAYCEDDATAPLGVYGRSKLEGELAVLAAHPEALIVRTSWVYSAYGSNFLLTMLRIARSKPSLRVVDDQHGCPTSAHDLADTLLKISSHFLHRGRPAGIYHLSGTGETTWFGLATEIFANLRARGLRAPNLVAITTADYPTPARRPRNSRLDCTKIKREFGIKLPPWPNSVAGCIARLPRNEDMQQC